MDNDLDAFPVDEASLPCQFTILGCDPVHCRRRGDFCRGRGGRRRQSLYGVYIRPEIKCRSFIFTPTCYVLCDAGGNNLTNVVLKWKIKRREGNREGESSEWNIRGGRSMFINYWQTFIALFKIREEKYMSYMNVMIFCYRLYVFKFHVLIRFIGGI